MSAARRRHRRGRPGAAVVAALLLLSAAVVTTGGVTDGGLRARAAPEAGEADDAEGDAADDVGGEDPPGDVVRIPFPQDDGSLTPYTFELGYQLMTLVYDTLLWRDADGQPQPWLAESVEASDDATELTVRLREGATWHDGEAVTADDVVFTFDFVAGRFHPRFTPQLEAVEAVTAADDHTVVVDLAHPSPGFVDQPLADLPILPEHRWSGLDEGQVPGGLPVGSGPYRLVAHDSGERYRFEAREDYFRGQPDVGAIEVPIIRTARETLQALERRDVDMVPITLPEDFQQRVEGLGVTVVDGPAYTGTTLLLNTRRPPFDDPAARRAVSRALDLTRMRRAIGEAVAADRGMVHPASAWAHDEELHDFAPEAAAEAVAGLDLPTLRVLAPDNDPVKVEAARQVSLAAQRAGAEAEVVRVSRQQLGSRIGEDGSAADFQLAIWASPPLASYDPNFLEVVFGSDGQQASLNHSGYDSAAFDELAQRVARTADPEQRRAAVHEQLELLARDAPVVPLFFADGAFAYRPAVHDGWTYVKGRGILDKRSFLAQADGADADQAADGDGQANPDGDDAFPGLDSDGLPVSPFAVLAGGLVVLAVVLAAGALVRGRR